MTPAIVEGDELPPYEVLPSIEQAVRYCAVAWAFPRVFFDADAARAQGMPGTLVPGPVKLGYLYEAVERWLGDRGFVREVRAAHRQPDVSARPLTVRGRVVRLYDENGSALADLDLAIINDGGTQTVRGFATVQFSS